LIGTHNSIKTHISIIDFNYFLLNHTMVDKLEQVVPLNPEESVPVKPEQAVPLKKE
jgi:hypothetical protein